MRESQTVLLSGLIFLGLAGFALSQDKPVATVTQRPHEQKAAKGASSASTDARPGDYPVIGYLEKQDRTITIKSGPKGRVYSVKTSNGKVLCENASLEELRAKAPELHNFVKTGVALGSEEQKESSRFDARIRVAPAKANDARLDARIR